MPSEASPRSPLSPQDIVVRVPDLVLALDATGSVTVTDGRERSLFGGPALLDLLQRLTHPCRIVDLLDDAVGSQEWIDRSGALNRLYAAGLVHRSGEEPARRSRAPFDDHQQQAAMLDDAQRTSAFLVAVRSAVRRGDVVVDIGTGTGVLAVAAALAGARRVFAVEAGAVAEVAEQLAERNGVADRVEVVRGWSTHVELPERADVVVSETIGSEPLCERILEVFRDARLRHAKPGAICIPRRLAVHLEPFEVPPHWSGVFSSAATQRWSARYGLDFGPLAQWYDRAATRLVPMGDIATWQRLGPAVTAADVDLTAVDALKVDTAATLTVDEDGQLGAVVTSFTAELAEGVVLTNRSGQTAASSWTNAVRFVGPWLVRAGDRIAARYRYRADGPDGVQALGERVEEEGLADEASEQ